MQDETFSKAMGMALRYLGIRARSEAEMQQYLKRKEWDERVIAAVMERLREYGYMNDGAFAEGMVNLQSKYRRKGSYVVEQKLYRAGVKKEEAQQALGEIDGDTEKANARYWVEKIAPALRGEEDSAKRRQKMYRRLANKGFSYEVIREACRDWEDAGEGFEDFDD